VMTHIWEEALPTPVTRDLSGNDHRKARDTDHGGRGRARDRGNALHASHFRLRNCLTLRAKRELRPDCWSIGWRRHSGGLASPGAQREALLFARLAPVGCDRASRDRNAALSDDRLHPKGAVRRPINEEGREGGARRVN